MRESRFDTFVESLKKKGVNIEVIPKNRETQEKATSFKESGERP
ncbi:hypothetical protein ACFFGV_16070 [Pontibacillus salicampi]|uniref:Uncharacterized protein n=1 Tax=Pontibacillus salicampi TaxID=1449801 RepID=A0ABV6LRS8_9BACI